MGDCNGEEAAEAAAVAVSKQQGLDECDEATAAAIRGAVPSDHNVVSVERRVKVTERSVLTVNGTQVSLEGAEGEAISAALLSGRMPDQDVINRILIKAGLILKPAKNVAAEMNVRETTVNSEKTQVTKEGLLLNENSTCTKEVRTTSHAALIEIWGGPVSPPLDSDLPARLLAREIIPIVGGGDPKRREDEHLFTVLLWSRLYATPARLLAEVGSCLPASASTSSESFLGEVVSLMSRWMTWFPEDFQDEAMTRKTRKIFQQIIDLQSAAFSAKLGQLLSTLTSHLAAMKRHEAWLEEFAAAASDLDDASKEDVLDLTLSNASATASELTRLELKHLSFLGPAEFVSVFAKGSKRGNDGDDTSQSEEKKMLSCIDDARLRAAAKTKKFDAYVGWFNRISYLVATTICKHKKKKHRVEAIEFWIEVARHCVNIGNFNSMMGIITGLNLCQVMRLKKTWTKIQSGKFAVLEHQMDPSCNFLSYRSTFNAAISRSESATDDRQRVTIPFFSLFVKDLYFAKENSKLDLDGHVLDLEKAGVIAAKVREFCKWKDAPNCPYEKNPRIERFLRASRIYNDDELDFESFLCEPATLQCEKDRYRVLKEKYKRSSSTASIGPHH